MSTFDLGNILRNAETIRGLRNRSAVDQLRGQFLQDQSAALNAQEERNATAFTEQQRIANTQWLAGATDFALNQEDPVAAARMLLPEAQRRGIVAEGVDLADGLDVRELELLREQANVGLAGIPGGQVRVQSSHTLENGNLGYLTQDGQLVDTGTRVRPQNLRFETFVLPDGRTIQGTQDPTTGQIFDLQGRPIAPAVRGQGVPNSGTFTAQPQQDLGVSRSPEDEAAAVTTAEERARADEEDRQRQQRRLESGIEAGNQALRVLDMPGLDAVYGAIQGRTRSIRQSTIDAEAEVDKLVAMLSLFLRFPIVV